jgi:hypothetical protein
VAAICSVCLRVFPVHHPPEAEGGETASSGASEIAVEEGMIAEEVAAEDWAAESAADADAEAADFVVVDMAIEGDPLLSAGLEAEVEEAGEVDDEPSDPLDAELVFEVEVIETEVVLDEFTLTDIPGPIADEHDADSIEDEAGPEVQFDETDHASGELLDVSDEAPAATEPEAESVAEPEIEVAPESVPVPEAIPVPERKEPSRERPVFEDLSSFTNEVLAESSSEAAPPVAERSRPAPEKVERFGRRDPHERARHLARVLVSDIIAYYPVRYQESLARRTLPEDFADEIQKSYREYVDQVGIEMAESTPYFVEALNHVLGRGEKFF